MESKPKSNIKVPIIIAIVVVIVIGGALYVKHKREHHEISKATKNAEMLNLDQFKGQDLQIATVERKDKDYPKYKVIGTLNKENQEKCDYGEFVGKDIANVANSITDKWTYNTVELDGLSVEYPSFLEPYKTSKHGNSIEFISKDKQLRLSMAYRDNTAKPPITPVTFFLTYQGQVVLNAKTEKQWAEGETLRVTENNEKEITWTAAYIENDFIQHISLVYSEAYYNKHKDAINALEAHLRKTFKPAKEDLLKKERV